MSTHHENEAFKRLVARDPTLVVKLMKLAGAEIPEHDSVQVVSINLDELIPDECGADAVVSFAAEDRTVWAAAVNVQLARDGEVQYTWPVHLATLFAQMSCRVVLVAICPDPDIAEWAAKPIVVGPGFELRPLVFGPDHVAGLPAAARRHLDAWSTTQDREHQCAATASFRHGCADRRNGPSDRRFARAGGAGLRSPRGLRGRATRRQAVCWLCVAHDRGESTPMITVD